VATTFTKGLEHMLPRPCYDRPFVCVGRPEDCTAILTALEPGAVSSVVHLADCLLPPGARSRLVGMFGLGLRAALIGAAVGGLLMFAIDAYRPETSREREWLYAGIAAVVVAAFVQGRLDKRH
jgi:hypothetical protein